MYVHTHTYTHTHAYLLHDPSFKLFFYPQNLFTNIIKLTQTKGLIFLFTGLLRTEQAGPGAPGGAL